MSSHEPALPHACLWSDALTGDYSPAFTEGPPLAIEVDCYAGYRGEETPRRFSIGDRDGNMVSLIVAGRLYQLQVLHHDHYTARAARQQQRIVKLDPPRGTIYDARGRELAVSVPVAYGASRPSATPPSTRKPKPARRPPSRKRPSTPRRPSAMRPRCTPGH